jgi:uncharacterized membrane protein
MASVLLVLRILHVVAACAFVGSVLFHYAIVRRSLRLVPPAYAVVLGQKIGTEFNYLGWAALGVLGITGALRIFIDGRLFQLLTAEFYGSGAGRALALMMVGWAVSVISAGIMTVLLRPVLMSKLPSRSEPDLATVDRWRGAQTSAGDWMVRLQVVTLVFSLLAAVAGASVIYGGLF